MDNVSAIIWDWNGTLLNDRALSVFAINKLLTKRGLPEIDEQKYLETFGFPVKDYYRRVGFDFGSEPFEIPAMEYIDTYYSNICQAGLYDGVNEVLEKMAISGKAQFILSAAEQGKLDILLNSFGIAKYFEEVAGLDHHYATSKVDLGLQMFERHKIHAINACLVGDTQHDYEVALALGCKCVLIANGHQARWKLEATGCKVIDSLADFGQFFEKV